MEVYDEIAGNNSGKLTREAICNAENGMFSVPYDESWGTTVEGDVDRILKAEPRMKRMTLDDCGNPTFDKRENKRVFESHASECEEETLARYNTEHIDVFKEGGDSKKDAVINKAVSSCSQKRAIMEAAGEQAVGKRGEGDLPTSKSKILYYLLVLVLGVVLAVVILLILSQL